MQTTQQIETPTLTDTNTYIIQLLKIQGIRTDMRNYTVKAAQQLPAMKPKFTVPTLARSAEIPRSKGYPTINELNRLQLVKPVEMIQRPPDWKEYTRSMRRRFNKMHGLPLRGIEPQRYTYTPNDALRSLRQRMSDQIQRIDKHALGEITRLSMEYAAIERGLSSHRP